MDLATLAGLGLLLVSAYAYRSALRRVRARRAAGVERWHSLPSSHGYYALIHVGMMPLLLLAVWGFFNQPLVDWLYLMTHPADDAAISQSFYLQQAREESTYQSLWTRAESSVILLIAGLALFGLIRSRLRHTPMFRARTHVESAMRMVMAVCALGSILITLAIVLSVVNESLRFFGQVPLGDFLFGLQWSPQTALRADQAGSSGAFGAVPLFAGTVMIMVIAMLVAVPVGLFAAIYMAEYASGSFRAVAKPLIELLAGIPTVVYGYFAVLFVAPFMRDMGNLIGLSVASESALAAGVVMGVMIIPFISSLSDDIITAVPRSLREASLGLGATKSETVKRVLLPAALPGIMGAVLLAISRAIGETMIVVMAAGLSANLTGNPLEAVTTVTVQIVTLLVGDQEFDSSKTLAAFALGLTLFVATLALNVVALMIVKRYREQYE